MGRRKSTSTRRKQKLQLEDNKKLDSSRAASNFDYAQMTSSSTALNKGEAQSTSDEATNSSDHQEEPKEAKGGAMETKLAGFLKEIYELGSNEQGEVEHVDNGQGSTPQQNPVVTENSNGDTDYTKVSSEVVDQASSGHLSQQTAATSHPPLPPSSSEHPQLEVSFWQEVTDPNTNHVYYWNPETNDVSWTLPANGVISNEVAGGTEMETENSAGGMEGGASAAQGDPVKNTATASGTISGSNSSSVKAKKKVEVDIFASAIDESNSTTIPGPSTKQVDQPTVVQDEEATAPLSSSTEESISSSKKRKASPQPRVMETASESLGDVVEAFPSTKRQRLIAPGSSVSSGVAVGATGEDGSGSKQAEQMLRFQVSNFADEFSRKLQYLHVSCEGLSDLQVMQVQLQTRLTDWKEGGLSSKYMLNKLRQFNIDLERYERSSAPEGWKFVWDSSTCRYKFYNLSTGESSWSYPMLGEQTAAPQARAKKEEEEFKGQDDVMETETVVKIKEQPVKPVGPVQPVHVQTEVPEVATVQPRPLGPQPAPPSQASQSSQQKPKQVKPVQPVQTTSKVSPTSTPQSIIASSKSKNQKLASYNVPTADYLRAPDGPVVLPVSRFQKRIEEKQAELENPVEGWNLSVRDVRKILGSKHRPKRSSSNDDIIREGDYPMDDEDDDEEVGGAKQGVIVIPGEKREQEYIGEFPPRHEPSPPPRRQTRLSSAKKAERSSASPVTDTITSLATAKPNNEASMSVSEPRKKSSRSTRIQRKQTPPITPPIPQPTALPPPHLKTPVTMVISRDPRVAKRQQQLIDKAQSSSSNGQPQEQSKNSVDLNESSKMSTAERQSPQADDGSQKSMEVDEARLRERLLLRQKYRVRKTSDRRDSREESSEERQTSPTITAATHPPPPSSAVPVKSCLVKSPTSSTPPPARVDEVRGAEGTPGLSEQRGQPYHLPRQLVPPTAEDSVEQSTGELELSPHKKAVFWIESKGQGPVDVTTLSPTVQQEGRGSGVESAHADSRVEPETGEVERMNIATSGTGSSQDQPTASSITSSLELTNEDTPTLGTPPIDKEQDEPVKSDQVDGDGDKDVSMEMSESSDENAAEEEKESKQMGVAIGRCYMDNEEEASDREAKVEESDQSDQDRHSRSLRRKRRHHSSRSKSRSTSRSRESRRKSSRKSSRRRKHEDDRSDYSDTEQGSRSRRYDDDRSDYSDENSEDHRSSSRHRSSRHSSKRYSSSKYSSSSKSSRRSSRKHRSHSRGDSRDRDFGSKGRDRDRDRSGFSSKHKKKDKKEKKKKRHRRSRSGSGDDKKGPQPNVLVGKVGKVGSVRTLGQDKKPSESEEGDAQNLTGNEATNQNAAAAEGGGQNQQGSTSQYPQQPDPQQQQQQQQYQYYQQHPSTGQMPYYGSTTGTYQDYMYAYSQDPYQQQAAWQAWQQSSGGGSQQADGWGSSASASTGHAQNQQQQQQYVAYPIPGGGAVPPPPPTAQAVATPTEAPPTSGDSGSAQAYTQQESAQPELTSVAMETPAQEGSPHYPPPSSPPPPPIPTSGGDEGTPNLPPAEVATTSSDHPLPTDTPTFASAPPPPLPSTIPTTSVSVVYDDSQAVPMPPAYEEGADTPPATPPQKMKSVESATTTTAVIQPETEEMGVVESEEEGGEEIMECDMEIENDESPEPSDKETTPMPPVEEGSRSISVAVPILMPPGDATVTDSHEGQKVKQVLPPTSQVTVEGTTVEDDEPLPPGVEDEEEKDTNEPLPPGIEDVSGVPSTATDGASMLPQDSKDSNQSAPPSAPQENDASATESSETTTDKVAPGTQQQQQQPGDTASTTPTTTIDATPPPSSEAVAAAYSAALATSSKATSSEGNYFNQTGATQYSSYAYGQPAAGGYGNYAAYNAYLQQAAAYGGYPGQYYQAYGTYGTQYPGTGYYGATSGAYTTPYQQQPQTTTQSSTSAPPASSEKPPPKVMMEQWNAFQKATTKK